MTKTLTNAQTILIHVITMECVRTQMVVSRAPVMQDGKDGTALVISTNVKLH